LPRTARQPISRRRLDHLARLRSAGGDVAEADDLVDVTRRDVGKDGVEGDAVAVDVAEKGEAGHCASLADARRRRPGLQRRRGHDFAAR
jgi:hypothetical protein